MVRSIRRTTIRVTKLYNAVQENVVNLNLNGLPEDGEESVIKLPIGAETNDPMSIWESKMLQPEPERLVSPEVTLTEVVTPERALKTTITDAALQVAEDSNSEDFQEAADALLDFITALVEMIQTETGVQDSEKLQTVKWEQISLSDKASLFIRFNDEKQDIVDEDLSEAELDMPCPSCGRPMREHLDW